MCKPVSCSNSLSADFKVVEGIVNSTLLVLISCPSVELAAKRFIVKMSSSPQIALTLIRKEKLDRLCQLEEQHSPPLAKNKNFCIICIRLNVLPKMFSSETPAMLPTAVGVFRLYYFKVLDYVLFS